MSELNVIDRQSGRTLRRLNPACFTVGSPLPGAICDVHGRVLAPAGWPLTAEDLHKLRGQIRRGVYGGDGWPAESFSQAVPPPEAAAPPTAPASVPIIVPHRGELVPVAIESLYVGKLLTHAIYNRHGVLLLAAGMEITHRFLGRLRQLGICEVHVPVTTVADRYQPTAGRIRIERELDAVVENLRRTELSFTGHLLPRRDLPLAHLRAELERGSERYLRSVDDVAEIAGDVLRGKASSVAGASDLLTPFMEMTSADSSLLPIIAKLKSTPGEYLFHHGLNVALLAMSAAARLGVRKEILLEIGLGALLQDVGMLRIDESVRFAARPLTPEERMMINEHPHYTLDLLHALEGIGSISLLICYQAHERADGTGYPRNRVRNQIHPFARLVGLADVYTAIGSHRPYRPAYTPYRAMESVLQETARNRFDAEVMRHFLNSVALFPIGSRVQLSTGETARVIRATPGRHTLPVVVLLDPAGGETDVEIDLSETRYAHVVQALG